MAQIGYHARMRRRRTVLSSSRWAMRLAVVVLLGLAGCGNCNNSGLAPDGAGGDDDGGGTIDGPGSPDALTCTGGSLCGQPASCCEAGNECVDDLCLPECATGIRCGVDLLTCCPGGDVCLNLACTTPGAACGDSFDCAPGEFCEPTLGQCLPQPDPLACEYTPLFEALSVTEEWSRTTDQIISIPVVADLDGDGVPEVVVNLTQQDGLSWPGGNIVGARRRDRHRSRRSRTARAPISYGSHGRSTIAVGDVSGDGLPDIIYASRVVNAQFRVADHRRRSAPARCCGRSHDAALADYVFTIENAAITLANFDADPMAEIVIGAALIDHDGRVMWDHTGNGAGPTFGTNSGYQGGISAVGDLDGDDAPEIVSGRNAWKVQWNATTPPTATVTPYWTYAGNDGYPAIVDLDRQRHPRGGAGRQPPTSSRAQRPERPLVVRRRSDRRAVHESPALRTQPLDIPGAATQNRGGPPTIADFDADGRPEIGVAGGYSYSLYDLNRTGEDVVQPGGDPAPAAGAIFVRWSQITQDRSSNASGSSVFDFQGDGVAEVVYTDECHMRVYRGTDGLVQLDIPNTTGTIHEYPLVVDVDGDNNSEILIVANDSNAATDCPGQTARRGIYVYGDVNDEWVPTRKVWTQHAYHVTNADSAGNVPMLEADNWLQPGLNNYRQNVQGDGIFNAPDLALTLSAGLDACGNGQLELRARVTNLGALGVPMGVVVSFYEGNDATGTLLGTGATTAPLLPGQSAIVRLLVPAPAADTNYYAVVDTAGGGAGVIAECDETNNGDGLTEAGCLVVD